MVKHFIPNVSLSLLMMQLLTPSLTTTQSQTSVLIEFRQIVTSFSRSQGCGDRYQPPIAAPITFVQPRTLVTITTGAFTPRLAAATIVRMIHSQLPLVPRKAAVSGHRAVALTPVYGTVQYSSVQPGHSLPPLQLPPWSQHSQLCRRGEPRLWDWDTSSLHSEQI